MKTSRAALPEAEEETRPETEEERWLRCAACEGRVARVSARIAMNGAHEHEFMNPGGLRFRVGCYASAPGCFPEGERSTVWTWFPGYAWQIERCRTCSTHLGWSFHREAASARTRARVGQDTSREAASARTRARVGQDTSREAASAFYGLVQDRLVQ
jgi:hypothetical protein